MFDDAPVLKVETSLVKKVAARKRAAAKLKAVPKPKKTTHVPTPAIDAWSPSGPVGGQPYQPVAVVVPTTVPTVFESTITQIKLIADQLALVRNPLLAKQAISDKDVNDHYHVLEMVDLNDEETLIIAKSLRSALKIRREIKESLAVLDGMASACDLYANRRNKTTAKYFAESMDSLNRIYSLAIKKNRDDKSI